MTTSVHAPYRASHSRSSSLVNLLASPTSSVWAKNRMNCSIGTASTTNHRSAMTLCCHSAGRSRTLTPTSPPPSNPAISRNSVAVSIQTTCSLSSAFLLTTTVIPATIAATRSNTGGPIAKVDSDHGEPSDFHPQVNAKLNNTDARTCGNSTPTRNQLCFLFCNPMVGTDRAAYTTAKMPKIEADAMNARQIPESPGNDCAKP